MRMPSREFMFVILLFAFNRGGVNEWPKRTRKLKAPPIGGWTELVYCLD